MLICWPSGSGSYGTGIDIGGAGARNVNLSSDAGTDVSIMRRFAKCVGGGGSSRSHRFIRFIWFALIKWTCWMCLVGMVRRRCTGCHIPEW